MTGTTYQITLSTGGRVAVTATTEDPAEMKAGLAWAQLAYKHLVDNQGKKEDQVKDNQVEEQQQEEEVPICAVHHVPMVKQRGRYGAFWSCHERNADGSFCSYKPEER